MRASAVFGVLVLLFWLLVLAVGGVFLFAYVGAWALTRRRPQWRILKRLDAAIPPRAAPSVKIVALKCEAVPANPGPAPARVSAEIIPFNRRLREERRRRA